MRNPVGWFGIHAQDMARAKTFYENVFGLPLQEIAGGRFYLFGTDWQHYGVSGMIWQDEGRQSRGLRRFHAVFHLRRLHSGSRNRGGARRQTAAGKIPHRQRFCRLCRRQRRQPHRPVFAEVNAV